MKEIFYKRTTRVVSRKVKNNLVLLDPYEGKFLTLNETATRLWRYLWKPRTVNNMKGVLIKEYKVNNKRLEQDLNKFLVKMIKSGLIKTV